MNIQRGKIVSGGRLQLPAELRRQLGLQDGDDVVMQVIDNELRIRSQREGVRRIQERFSKLAPADVLFSDELIADRRREADNE
jgi:antitoxin PrlF